MVDITKTAREMNVRQLRSQLPQVPKEYRMTHVEPKGHKGICVARDTEADDIMQYFQRQWAAEGAGKLQSNDCIAYLLTNAPGAGKTTLREECMLRQLANGVTVIELGADQLTDDERFIAGLLAHVDTKASKPAPTDTLVTRVYRTILTNYWTAPVAGVGLEVLVELPALPTMTMAGISWLQEAHKRITEAAQDHWPATPEEAIKMINKAHQGKYILTIDECQKWGNAGESRGTLSANLDLIANPSVRSANNLQGGGALLAGLGDTAEYMDGLGLTRARVAWLGPLTREAAVAGVQHYITAAGDEVQYESEVTELWVEHLVDTFSHWPQHVATAGLVAALTLEEATREEVPVEDEARMTELLSYATVCTAEVIGRLYQERVNRAAEGTNDYTPTLIAALAEAGAGKMTLGAVDRIIHEASRVANQRMSIDEGHTARRRLKRAGLLGRDPEDNPDPEDVEGEEIHDTSDTRYTIGIPSLGDYIRTGQPDERWQGAMRIAETQRALALDANPYEPPADDEPPK